MQNNEVSKGKKHTMNPQEGKPHKVRLVTLSRVVEKITQPLQPLPTLIQERKPLQIGLTALSHTLERITQPSPVETTDTIIIGKTNRKVFWSVFLVSIFMMSAMVYMVGKNSIALAAVALPVDFTITADNVNATNFTLVPGLSSGDGKTAVAVVKMDATITNQVITKKLGPVTVKITAGGNGTPVTVTGLTVDATSIDASTANFQNLNLTTGPAGDSFQQSATSQILTNAVINTPYLLANSISLPGLSVSISVGP